MPGVRDSDSSLVASDIKQSRSKSHKAPRRREIVIQIFASDARDSFSDLHDHGNSPTLALARREPTEDDLSSDDGERHDEKLSRGYRVPEIRVSTVEETPVRVSRSTSRSRQTTPSVRTETTRGTVYSDGGPDTTRRSSSSSRPQERRNVHSQSPLERGEHPLRTEVKYDSDRPERSGNSPQPSSYELSINLPKRQHSRKYDRHGSKDTEPSGPPAIDTEARDLGTPLGHESNVRDQVDYAHGPAHSLSLEQFRKEIGWPVDYSEDPDHQRFSGVSTASTVEAVIVDPVRSTKPILRHTEKRFSLRSASSPVTKLEHASMASGPDTQHRLVHKAARITDEDRRNIAPEMSVPAAAPTSEAPHQNVDVVPVVVIPERRSSLKNSPSTSTSRNPSKASSQRSRRRAATAPGSRASSLGPPRRTDSVAGSRRPVIPPRRSSLSTPTSANNSRATSLTSDSLRSHTLAIEDVERRKRQAEQPRLEPPRQTSRPNSHMSDTKTQSILIGIEDTSDLLSPSMPLSLGSMPSSPGWELSEAKAVSLYPHNNESLLVIDQQKRRERKASEAQRRQTTAMSQAKPKQLMSPPIQVSPPTPPKELERDSDTNDREPAFRRFGSLRRAWTVRSRPGATDTLKRSFSTSATNRKAGKDPNSRFWRLRNSTNSSAKPPSPSQTGNKNEHIVKNSLGMPQPRVVFNGPDVHPRHQARPSRSETRKRTRLYNPSLNRSTLALGNTLSSPGFLDRTTRTSPLRRRSFHLVSMMGYRVRFATMQKRLRRRMQLRGAGAVECWECGVDCFWLIKIALCCV
ncbi:uncharacterized protein ASPGLDRAFT_1108859 [Aspergillus glaucus CBS 516.65]|uniref:Uncharacterized protein n=1 Tax=Aspergillus glaucus CBS 516.65 TaxID=1160497 RepID=A0A1L9VSR6_ASPGL|nr:hypothetical protein ASPGLDRAFT_1108859 [Aspergillus glaucus CBS 516.65]OJJ86949.1 hypothetical protein ASPGLDRAFT_1108859 [Aspergillus glaucus CBS 516.65]